MASNAGGIFRFDVFLSFRGEDTRFGFTGNLWKALRDRGIRAFMDDEELRKGEEITPSLVKAIEGSRMAIVVLSQDYASSSFCLQELSKILECCQKENGRSVWPVFYDVDPSDVRKLTGTYGEAMAMHEARSNDYMDGLMKWKEALHQVANLSGFHFKNGDGYEHEFIGKIVKQVSRQIKPINFRVVDYLVGLECQKQNVTSLLKVGSDDEVHMIGIHGMGGIGKTTLALEVYNLIAHQFEGLCFLEKVRENSEKHGLLYLQKILLSELVGEKKIELTSVRQGISIIQERLRQKKVILILDDVDKRDQLQAIVGGPEWFGPGSRVIITTRDKSLLTCHGVECTYEVQGLDKKDAIELLSWKAFKTDEVSPSYTKVLNHAVNYASGLPLALEVIGSHLFRKSIEEWESALGRYERIPNKEIQNILKVSFDALDEEEKSVFLDIVCYFKGHKLAMVEKLLHAHYGDSKKDHISVLVEKSLIKITDSSNVTVHDLIEDMGKEIVRQESPEEPGQRSRLWFSTDIVHVLEENTELHEAGNTKFSLPLAKIPEWFDHQCMQGLSISFWFRNMFPAIVLCVVSKMTWNDPLSNARVIINNNTFFYRDVENTYNHPETCHLHIFHMQLKKFNDILDKALLENKWNHVEVDFGLPFQKSGIHVLEEKSCVSDIRFTNPENDVNIELTL